MSDQTRLGYSLKGKHVPNEEYLKKRSQGLTKYRGLPRPGRIGSGIISHEASPRS